MRDKLAACLALIFICSLCSASVLAAEEIILRTAVTPGEAWVGQKVVLHVDVLAKDGWAQLKKVTDTEVEGAYLLRLESQGTRLSETIDGDSYTGQRYDFMLFAQRDGKITIPPVLVDVEIKTWGAGGGSRIERMSLPLVEFVTRTPPGAQGIRGLISTSNLTAHQDWDPETESPVVGDAIKRRITLRAEDVSGMAFAPTLHNEMKNLGIYPGEPTVEDKFARGDLTGTRVETVTYVVERAGDFELPSIELSWWNIDTQELQHIVLPGLTLQVTGGPAGASKQDERRSWSAFIVLLVVVVVLLVFGGRVLAGWTAWRQARNETEAAYFRRIRRSARTGDQKAVLRDTMRWLDRINNASQAARLDLFMQKYGDSRAREAILDRSEPGTMAFVSSLAAARKRWQEAQQRGEASYFLPDLNG
ncbi:MAG: hypothetical protein DRR11_08740 [Gammaproteobacteria bacterium]|nr:MAG: hypothetical protein DRR15_14865 [Gammaproteobacteria bacterium]RLA32274.1 MAG: hypothetical protein DRR11_08740 [Gammaproteobacteria bacterium]